MVMGRAPCRSSFTDSRGLHWLSEPGQDAANRGTVAAKFEVFSWS